MGFLNTIVDNALNVIFPIHCIDCGKTGELFCSKCLYKAPAAEREVAAWIYPLFDYRHPPIKKALWRIKYEHRKSLMKIFAEVMYDRILVELSELGIMENFTKPLLIPIPLSKNVRRKRGYNQAELVCKELIKLDSDANYELNSKILIKVKETEHQAHTKNKSERMRNLIGAFSIPSETHTELVKGRNIILIDDITTTGATLEEAKKILKAAGARKIIAFTVAH